jgi:alcohol dehydrogenase class IV
MLAGWVQNHCIVGLSHAIAHQLGSFDIGHGLANGLLMPAVINFNCQDKMVADKYTKLVNSAGVPDITALLELFELLVYEQKTEKVFSEQQLTQIAENALLDPAAKSNPVRFTEDDVKEIVKQCL